MKNMAAVLAVFVSGYSCIANAAPITSLQTTVIAMPALNIDFATGVYTQAPGITWSGDGGAFGSTQVYYFGTNGFWSGSPPYAAVNSDEGSMQFSFAQPVSAVGGLINYSTGDESLPVISIYNSSNQLLESSQLSFSTDGTGEFHGFQLANPLISSFRLSGSYMALRNLTILASSPLAPVPEPETYAMLLAGLGLMATVARRKRPLP